MYIKTCPKSCYEKTHYIIVMVMYISRVANIIIYDCLEQQLFAGQFGSQGTLR